MKTRFRNIFHKIILSLFLIICTTGVFGQTFTASVNRNPVGVDEQFQLSFSLKGSGSSFKAPDLSDFMVLSGPNQSSSMQFINGAVSQSITFSYILQPKKQGTFKIEAASVESEGKIVLSNILTVNVNAGSNSGSSSGNNDQDDKTKISSKNIFIRASVDKKNVYLGEAITITYKLYTNVQVVNYSINKIPSLKGFWSQEIELPQQLRLYNEVYNGVNYQVGEIKKVVAFPQQSGTLIIDPMEGECIARIQVKRNKSNSPFDIFNDPFFNDPFFRSGGIRDVRFAVKSESLKINVKPLPGNAPASFNGAVGRFSMEGIIDKTSAKTNDAINFRLKIAGKGNLKLIDAPSLDLSPDIESYDPKINDRITVNERGASGNRTFEYLLIPRHQGKYKFGPVDFTYFDLDKRKYVTLNTPVYNLDIERGKDGGGAIGFAGRSDFKVLGRDIRFIKTTATGFVSWKADFYNTPLFYLLLLLPLTIIVFLFIYRRRHIKLNADISAVKSRKANKMARKRLQTANKFLKAGDTGSFFDEAGNAIWGYLSDKLKIPVSSLTKESVTEALKKNEISVETIDRLIEVLNYCEYSRYAKQDGGQSAEKVYEDIVSLLIKTEDEFKGK